MARNNRSSKEEKYETRSQDLAFKVYIDKKASEAAGRPVPAVTVKIGGGISLYQSITEKNGRRTLNHRWEGDGISYQRSGPLPRDLQSSNRYTTAYMSLWVCNGREWRPVVSKKKNQADKTLFENLISSGIATQAERRFRVFDGAVLKQCWAETVEIEREEGE